MKREDIDHIISVLLIFSTSITGIVGYIQSRLELRRLVPHHYLAYVTLVLAALHVFLNWDKADATCAEDLKAGTFITTTKSLRYKRGVYELYKR